MPSFEGKSIHFPLVQASTLRDVKESLAYTSNPADILKPFVREAAFAHGSSETSHKRRKFGQAMGFIDNDGNVRKKYLLQLYNEKCDDDA